MTKQAEQFPFQAEVNEVLSIVVNSLYSHKEVFLRELISNASDALDHLSFKALTEHGLLGDDRELRIEVVPDAGRRTLTIRDNGIGMTRDELISHLGTIARSGSKKLMQSLQAEQKKDLALIGQFGVGFYSAYLVADRVTVVSRAAGADKAWQWESDAKGGFTIEEAERAGRGTDVVLHLKEDEREFLQEWSLRSLVRKYSDYVRHPIRLWVDRSAEKGESRFETVNQANALWARPRTEITRAQYEEFYKHVAHDWEAPLAWTHFKVEGTSELTGLLFLPRAAPFDLADRKPKGVRLYVKRVFILEDCEELLPEWLRFLRGVLDSEDLPLNVSREILQQDRATRLIRKQVVKHALGLLEELAAEGEVTEQDQDGKETKVRRYEVFWRSFGRLVKEGVHFEPEQRDRLVKLLRYPSTRGDELVSLEAYVQRMPEGQKDIYYVAADSLAAARKSPHLEALAARGYEVLLMTDPVDEWLVADVAEFSGKRLVSAAKGELDLPASDAEREQRREKAGQIKGVLDAMEELLGARVKEVRATDRLTGSPACLVTDEKGISPHVERLLRANGQDVPPQKRTLELNPDHPVVHKLRALAADPARKDQLREWSELLYDQALLAEGGMPEDPARFAQAVARLMQQVSS
ncbi:MAG: molecular chaperone HtpG [Planctomycetes bacterium]|nr:molecular chaperone HtpG [Planctomycetota bacterium]